MVSELMRVARRTVVRILSRAVEDASARVDLLAGVRRIGIDETSYRRGHRYLLVVVCHDTGRLLWAAEGRNQQTLQGFFDGGRRPGRSAAPPAGSKATTRCCAYFDYALAYEAKGGRHGVRRIEAL